MKRDSPPACELGRWPATSYHNKRKCHEMLETNLTFPVAFYSKKRYPEIMVRYSVIARETIDY
jgi:hypothetical protein